MASVPRAQGLAPWESLEGESGWAGVRASAKTLRQHCAMKTPLPLMRTVISKIEVIIIVFKCI